MSDPAESDIRAFWAWFESVSSDLAEDFDNEELVAALDTRVAELGNLEWELGPGATRPNALVIPPGGDPELLRATRKVVSKAPAITGWEFLHARPPKQWQMRFTIEDRSGAVREVDASGWRYVLLRYPDGAHEVIIEAPSVAEFDEELAYSPKRSRREAPQRLPSPQELYSLVPTSRTRGHQQEARLRPGFFFARGLPESRAALIGHRGRQVA